MSVFKPVPETSPEPPVFSPKEAGFVPAPVVGQESASWMSKLSHPDSAADAAIIVAIALGVAVVILVVLKLFDGLTLDR